MSKAAINPRMKDFFIQFSRNGRWGTCGDCPRDSNGLVYPEFCIYTDRGDHHLSVEALAQQHTIALKDLHS